MARPLRIEYPGATYHVMARGNQGRPIYQDDRDRKRFMETIEEVCEKAGWRIHAWVLMGNHYHLLVETPEANLVAGMKWLQGTYTQRYNRRHEISGHLFQGRYKAVPVEGENAGYLEAVSTYIHLNPARSGLIQIGKQKLRSYSWSSYPAYLSVAERGPTWLERRRVMGALRLKPEDRHAYETYVEARVLELALKKGRDEWAGQWKELRDGWFVGGEQFGSKLREQIEKLVHGHRRESHSGEVMASHGEHAAEQLLRQGLSILKWQPEDLNTRARWSPEKAALAKWLRQRTTVSLRWISEKLKMGHYTNVIRSAKKMKNADCRKMRLIQNKLETRCSRNE